MPGWAPWLSSVDLIPNVCRVGNFSQMELFLLPVFFLVVLVVFFSCFFCFGSFFFFLGGGVESLKKAHIDDTLGRLILQNF